MKKENIIFELSVGELVSFSANSGDIKSSFFDNLKATDGIEGHQYVQKKYCVLYDSYQSEYTINSVLKRDLYTINLSGRIDGIIKVKDSFYVHEIRTTRLSLENIFRSHNMMHWAQAKIYAYMYCIRHGLSNISIMLTYYNPDMQSEKTFEERYTLQELCDYTMSLTDIYIDWKKLIFAWHDKKIASIIPMHFPFDSYRIGQKSLIFKVYNAIKSSLIMFVQAPTGPGKTMSTIYPAIKSMGEQSISRIFYLTAKNITREVAGKAIDDMRKKGLFIKSLILTSKEKSCFNDEVTCLPEKCEYAKGYYDRIREAVRDIFINEDFFTFDIIQTYAEKHQVCPFEFSLDISIWSDVIICDYNYLFDPRASLKRFFEIPNGNYCFLIDEAHNLVDRARDMYSSVITQSDFSSINMSLINSAPKLNKLITDIVLCMTDFKRKFFKTKSDLEFDEYDNSENMRYSFEKNMKVSPDSPDKLLKIINSFLINAEKWLIKNNGSEIFELVLDIYFKGYNFSKISELYSEKYVTIYDKSDNNIAVKLFCIDPSFLLNEKLKLGKASALFSATLTPNNYFSYILGGGDDFANYSIPSPFSSENLLVFIDDSISTKYRDRYKTYDKIVDHILSAVSQRIGNYMVFFPSFEYLEEIYIRFYSKSGTMGIIRQYPSMKESDRIEFLSNFMEYGHNTLVGFAVMGGVFGEGIDLEGDKLSGVIVVGVGLPGISFEKNIIKSYFDEWDNCGFDYSYVYPGINKVLQAVGRVIRTESDRGFAILIDDRFSQRKYKELLPLEWQTIYCSRDYTLDKIVQDFWD